MARSSFSPWPLWLLLLACCRIVAFPDLFQFPTPNRRLLQSGAEADFFVGTPGKPWTSGTFGCVRTEGRQMHEGLDIKALQRDRQNEPTDPVFATADGMVVYLNEKSGLSNYGKYLILQHKIQGLEIYSLYAHLRSFAPGISSGQRVRAGQTVAQMGRTTNTRTPISKERAHLHFELNLMINERFDAWHKKSMSGQRNDHGKWNGQNFIGLDPRELLLPKNRSDFNLLEYVRNQTELCRIQVRATRFPWLQRYTPLVKRNPTADREGIAGFEVALNFNGAPFLLIPLAPSELKSKDRIHLVSVNDGEPRRCRGLVARAASGWRLTEKGTRLIDLLVY